MNMDSSDDREALPQLLHRIAQGDERAFAELYQRTSAKLYGVCLRMLRERGEAEDALQNIYLILWRRADRFDPARAAAMTWLITLTRNQCIDRLRRHREAPLNEEIANSLADPEPGPSMRTEAGEQRRRLDRCLDTLAAQQKSAVRAAFFMGVTYNELADLYEVPLATMKSWIRRSLIRLRRCLES